jgi:uracil-DNA glycosylase family 4
MNDPTRFDLDERQRAMLAEMGVRVWTPAMPAPLAVPSASSAAAAMAVPPALPVADAPVSSAPAPASVRPAAPVRPAPAAPIASSSAATAAATDAAHPPLPAGLAEMDWAALQSAGAHCQACGLCAQRQHSVFGVGSMQADWLFVGDAPGEAENASGQPFAGDAGRLLDNMLKAVGLSREGEAEKGAYLMHATQCATPDARNPAPEELSLCAAYVSRKVALVQPRVIVAMGRFAMQSLLQTTEPLGKMRGQLHHYQGVPVVVTYPPAYLLRNPTDKGKAWADLCLALQVVQGKP